MVNVNSRDHTNNTPLHHAAIVGKGAIARILIERGAELTPVNASGMTEAM